MISKMYDRFGSRDYRAAGKMRPTLVKVVNEDLTPLLPAVQAPTLILWGDQDQEVPRSAMEIMAARIPRARLVVFEGAGHFPFLDMPEEFCETVKGFLRAGGSCVTGAWLRWPAAAGWWVARIVLPYALVVVQRHLDCIYILQLERYKPDRYARWMPHALADGASRPEVEIGLQALTVGVASLARGGGASTGSWSMCCGLAAGHVLLGAASPLQVSQRLQWTSRAFRVSVVAFA